jgi:hypothetical protein
MQSSAIKNFGLRKHSLNTIAKARSRAPQRPSLRQSKTRSRNRLYKRERRGPRQGTAPQFSTAKTRRRKARAMSIIAFHSKNTSREALADFVNDLVARNLSPERILVAIFQRLNGVTTNDLLLAIISALTAQRELLAANEREVVGLSRQVDGLEVELRDLLFEIGRLQERAPAIRTSTTCR